MTIYETVEKRVKLGVRACLARNTGWNGFLIPKDEANAPAPGAGRVVNAKGRLRADASDAREVPLWWRHEVIEEFLGFDPCCLKAGLAQHGSYGNVA